MALLNRLGLSVPIFAAPMAGMSTPALAAAVSNAGGLGGLGIGTGSLEAARKMITETQRLTSKSFNVNLFVHQPPRPDTKTESGWLEFLKPIHTELDLEVPTKLPDAGKGLVDNAPLVDLLLELKPPVISFHFGIPEASVLRQLRDSGAVLMATATNLDELNVIEKAKLDAVIAQGSEAGGHRGVFDPKAKDDLIPTLELVRLFNKHTSLPIIAAGGLMYGKDIKAALSAGATAAQLGTAFIPCPESTASEAHTQALLKTRPEDTTFTTVVSGRPARGIKNRFTALEDRLDGTVVPDFPLHYGLTKQLMAEAKKKGVEGYEVMWAGTEAARSRAMPAADLVKKLSEEMEAA